MQYGPSILARALYLHEYQLLPYARTAEAMRELFGCTISRGTLATAVRQCAEGLIETELQIKRGLRRSHAIHAYEDGVAGRGKAGLRPSGEQPEANALRGGHAARQGGDGRNRHPAPISRHLRT